jgi:nitrite reductase/ring-hydroxylating ferredoxin subunit
LFFHAERRSTNFTRRPPATKAIRESAAVPTRVELCKADQVAAGTALRVEAAGLTVAVFNIEGEFYVTDDNCTHGPGSLSEGYIDGDVIECNFHNGQFNIKTGEVVSPPCMIPVKTYPATVENGAVFIDVD